MSRLLKFELLFVQWHRRSRLAQRSSHRQRPSQLLWQQEKQAKNSADIVREASELHGRLTVFIRHFAKVGATLTKTVDAYNDSIGSFDRKVMPAARKVAALGNFDGVIENIPHVDVKARASDYEPSLEAVPDSDVS